MHWDQLRAIGWLRWQLTRNQMARNQGLGALVSGIMLVASALLALAAFTAGVVGGTWLKDADAVAVVLAWLGLTMAFLMFWLMGLLLDLQRAETIDLPRLMHLPVALGQIFVVNFLSSHVAVSLIVMVPAMFGLATGLAAVRGPQMWLLVPAALSMVLMVTAWTYWLRGWLATLIDTPSRRRLVVTVLTVGILAVVQGPNLYFNLIRGSERLAGQSAEARAAADDIRERDLDAMFRKAERVVPVLWVSGGARALAEGRVLPSLAGTLGASLLALLGLAGAYRSTLRFYRGEVGRRAPARRAKDAQVTRTQGPSHARRASIVDGHVPLIPEPAAAVALATLQTMVRASEVMMQWGLSLVFGVVIGASLLLRREASLTGWVTPFVATGSVIGALITVVQFFANQFGLDREGFRAFVLAPIDRGYTLLGKNLALMLPAGGLALVLVVGTCVWLRLPGLTVVATLLQLVACLLGMAILGNAASIVAPYRLQAGTVKPSRMPALSMLVVVLLQLGMPLALTPALLPALAGYLSEERGGPPAAAVNAALSALLVLAMGWAYARTLAPLGRWLHRREPEIIRALSDNVE